jgi:hypothetical protein
LSTRRASEPQLWQNPWNSRAVYTSQPAFRNDSAYGGSQTMLSTLLAAKCRIAAMQSS